MKSARTRIKICGLKDPEHVRIAAGEGADAIGLIFFPPSSRYVSIGEAEKVANAAPPYVTTTAVFVNEKPETIRAILERVPVGLLQFQGDETPEFCAGFAKPFVRAVRMEKGVDLVECSSRFSSARGLLLDAHVAGEVGGTGTSFDWSRIPREALLPLILSGGLTPKNVGRAVREVRPWAVDVSSGVEKSRGIKDPALIVEFIRSVQREDAGQSA
jgi:phosphoribosylanthranilate isomerase